MHHTTLPGRYRDPAQHTARMQEMEARCNALFGGSVSSNWSVVDHKSIACHLCNTTISPYSSYHPDTLRKHFVRRHEVRRAGAGKA